MATGSDITFGTILEEDYQAIHAAEDRQKQRGLVKASLLICRCQPCNFDLAWDVHEYRKTSFLLLIEQNDFYSDAC